jgi:hypothetical protein
MTQDGVTEGGTPRVDELPHLARGLLARSGADPGPLRLVHLRCKPGRGSVARLRPELGVPPRRVAAPAPVWLSVESANGAGVPERMSVHGFGDDPELPALGAARTPLPGTEVWAGLERAAQLRLGEGARLVGVAAEPIRYKPGSRCVFRYRLAVAGGESVVVFGKLFAEPLHALAVEAVTRRLHAEQLDGDSPPVVPRPLGALEGAGLAFSAAGAEGDGFHGPLRSGIRVLLPSRHGGAAVPVTALTAAAEAIARLHSSSIGLREGIGVLRTGAREAQRALDRAALLSDWTPELGPRLATVAGGIAARLRAAVCDAPVPSHGGFKPSQLVYSALDRVVLTDLDGICLADPALDLGYFLAYLRPLSLWTERPAVETWFAFAAAAFLRAYVRSMLRGGMPAHSLGATLERVPLYESALLLKIAARRPQRVNAPRPAELGAVLDDIGLCLRSVRRAA